MCVLLRRQPNHQPFQHTQQGQHTMCFAPSAPCLFLMSLALPTACFYLPPRPIPRPLSPLPAARCPRAPRPLPLPLVPLPSDAPAVLSVPSLRLPCAPRPPWVVFSSADEACRQIWLARTQFVHAILQQCTLPRRPVRLQWQP